MTNVLPGDLAVIVRNNIDPSNNGAFVIVQNPYPHAVGRTEWAVLPQRPVIAGTEIRNGTVHKTHTIGPLVIADACLRRIAPQKRIVDGVIGRGDRLRPSDKEPS